MSSRPPATAAQTVSYRQDDERRRDEARFNALQDQLDELRQVARELIARQERAEELLQANEGGVEQQRLVLEQARQEARQIAQARALDENRTRQYLADVEARVDDAVRPIRSLQAHVQQLVEAARAKTDDTGQHQKRYDELRVMIEHLAAHGDRTLVITHQLRDAIDLMDTEIDALRRDVMRAEDGVKIVDQETRRRVAEVAQIGDAFAARFDELRSDLAHVYDLIEETRRSTAHVDPALEQLHGTDVALRQDLARFQAQVAERLELVPQRFEDIRQEADTRFAELRQAHEQRAERLAARLDEMGEIHRELGNRLNALAEELDQLHLVDDNLRRDLWHLHEQRARLRVEQAQQELDQVTAQRRTDDPNPAANDRLTRRPHDLLG